SCKDRRQLVFVIVGSLLDEMVFMVVRPNPLQEKPTMDWRKELPAHFTADAETVVATRMGRFTIYPGDEVETVDARSLVVRRDGRELKIAWAIVSPLQPAGPAYVHTAAFTADLMAAPLPEPI